MSRIVPLNAGPEPDWRRMVHEERSPRGLGRRFVQTPYRCGVSPSTRSSHVDVGDSFAQYNKRYKIEYGRGIRAGVTNGEATWSATVRQSGGEWVVGVR